MFILFRDIAARHHAALTGYSYSYGGDMRGSHRFISVEKADDEKALVVFSESEWHYQDPVVEEYYVPVSVLESIEKLYDTYGIYRLPFRPKNKFKILDGGSSSYSFSFANRKWVRFGSWQRLTKKGMEGMHKIDALIMEAVQQTEKLPGLVQEVGNADEEYSKIKAGKCMLQVYEYSNNYLNFRLANGYTEPVKITENVVLYRLNGSDRQEIYRNDVGYEHKVSANYCWEGSIQLKEVRLEEGTYVLMLDGYEKEFVIR